MSNDLWDAAPDPARHARLVQLAPADAARTLLEGDFMPGDEPPLCFAIRRDARVTLDDDAILDVFVDVLDDHDADGFPCDAVSPQDFLDRLAAASRP